MAVTHCVNCGHKMNSEATRCPECGRYVSAQAEGGQTEPQTVSLGFAQYLGGHPELGNPRSGRLYITPTWFGFGATNQPEGNVLPMSTVASVNVSGREIAKNKIAATVLFGVWGGLAAKGTKDRTYLVVHTKSGPSAYYQLEGRDPMQVRATLAPFLDSLGVPLSDEVVQPGQQGVDQAPVSSIPAGGLVDQVARLAALHDAGALTDEEFAAAKAKLLA